MVAGMQANSLRPKRRRKRFQLAGGAISGLAGIAVDMDLRFPNAIPFKCDLEKAKANLGAGTNVPDMLNRRYVEVAAGFFKIARHFSV